MLIVLIRTIILYFIIVLGTRIMGKRQLGELQPSDLVITILISNIATLPIEETEIPLVTGIIPILTLVCFEVFSSALSLKSPLARRLISGRPIVIIQNGRLNQKEMRDLRFSLDDLMEQLRGSGIFDLSEVQLAIVETTGKLSIYQKFPYRPATAQTLQIPPPPGQDNPPRVIISDGVLQKKALAACNLSERWLAGVLQAEGCTVQEVFLLSAGSGADYLLVKKER